MYMYDPIIYAYFDVQSQVQVCNGANALPTPFSCSRAFVKLINNIQAICYIPLLVLHQHLYAREDMK